MTGPAVLGHVAAGPMALHVDLLMLSLVLKGCCRENLIDMSERVALLSEGQKGTSRSF